MTPDRPPTARSTRRWIILGVVAAALGASGTAAAATPFPYGAGPCPPAEGVTEPVRHFTEAPQLCIDPARTYTARFVTSEGDIVVALDAAGAPGTVNNFVTLARYRYYDDTPIFRAEPMSDLIQGGGLDASSAPGYSIPDEGTGYTYPPGTLAMARTSEPNSAGGQWFFTTGDQARYLDQYGTFVPFGTIVEGLDVAQRITDLGDVNGLPTVPITLVTIEITES